jgi:hypothetical protein
VNSDLERKGGSADDGTGAGDPQDPGYVYKDSGIREMHGHVPLWLWVVTVGLVIWSVYYLIVYWSPAP